MKVSVVVDNYNYDKFLPACIESVLNQTYKDFELIIVDDGSEDNSKQIIEEYAKKDDRIIPIFQENGGQASAFNEGVKRATGEIICFLDSDDLFKPTKLQKVVEAYKKGYDYIIHDYELIGDTSYSNGPYNPYGGYHRFLIYYKNTFTGSTTSNVSISKKLADEIFPLKYVDYYRVRADDVVVFYAGMMADMYFIHEELSEYRIHGKNLYACTYKQITHSQKYHRDTMIYKVRQDILDKLGMDERFFLNPHNLINEFKTKHIIDFFIFRVYWRILMHEMDAPISKKLQIAEEMMNFYEENKVDFKPAKRIHYR